MDDVRILHGIRDLCYLVAFLHGACPALSVLPEADRDLEARVPHVARLSLPLNAVAVHRYHLVRDRRETDVLVVPHSRHVSTGMRDESGRYKLRHCPTVPLSLRGGGGVPSRVRAPRPPRPLSPPGLERLYFGRNA